jgi:hypothetical protein
MGELSFGLMLLGYGWEGGEKFEVWGISVFFFLLFVERIGLGLD